MSNYKDVFQLAQDKGFLSNPNNKSLFEELDEVIQTYARGTSTYDCGMLLKLTVIQKWLRDEHKIGVNPNTKFIDGKESSFYMLTQGDGWMSELFDYPSYEEALIAGIEEALKLIK